MPLITGEQYTESTRALNLPVYIFGKKVENPVDDPILRPALSSVRIENLCFGTVAIAPSLCTALAPLRPSVS